MYNLSKRYTPTHYMPRILKLEKIGGARIYEIKNTKKEIKDDFSDDDYFKAQIELLKKESLVNSSYPLVELLWRDNFLTRGTLNSEFPWTFNLANYELSEDAKTAELLKSTGVCRMEFKILDYELDNIIRIIDEVVPVDQHTRIDVPPIKILDYEWRTILKKYLEQDPFVLVDKK